MADIYAATGLKPGNLYATFKDKETLFRRSFETYAAHFRSSLPQGLTGLAAIRAWIDKQVRLAIEDPERKGCLIINTITEREVHSERNRAMARERLDEITAFFADALAEARDGRQVSATADIAVTASALTGTVVAIMALGRAGADPHMIEAVGRAATDNLRSVFVST